MLNYRKFRLARVWSNEELRKVAHLFTGKVINVSAGDNVDKEGGTYDQYFTNASEFWKSNYSPGSFRGYKGGENEILLDLEQDLPEEHAGQFDVVFNHTTLEHVFHVFKAFENICKLSADIVIIVVPFAQEQHESGSFKDFWRFTPTVLKRLFTDNGLTVIYENANNDFNAATYLFMVASRHPERWSDKMPPLRPEGMAATWIGDTFFRRLIRLVKP
jgi:hypothetical protein